ncbi:MAG: tetratricopeptide repeat protein, partial [Gemmatimonadetes bacterium]|nr:tetratricopeptide repeat protein [Gemmatimonadota bacterium]NIT88478.1 tetratricopeptide repeat protein [Gemmatimonadota bacterium]NIU79858.1 tetratricopeptide repeat protein [Gammaproteobacteria bacterium]NIX40723.1 tetratricopeptide repeat protein [Gemmatimonadota bacterium]NIY40455.1 tetratricopeptide repeat protein [Gemmatimonadota bacterium]
AGHALLAVTLTELEEWDEAEASARTAIGHDPELPLAHYALATVLLDRRRYDEAAATAREAIR